MNTEKRCRDAVAAGDALKSGGTKQAVAWFSGCVQGVGFRFTAKRIAADFSVRGYVKNLPDGRVEVLAEGKEQDVRAFLDAIAGSHLRTHIRSFQTEWREAQGRHGLFEITF